MLGRMTRTISQNLVTMHVTILHIAAVISPLIAARAAIVQEFSNAKATEAEEGREGT